MFSSSAGITICAKGRVEPETDAGFLRLRFDAEFYYNKLEPSFLGLRDTASSSALLQHDMLSVADQLLFLVSSWGC
jgi:hypothetical protein